MLGGLLKISIDIAPKTLNENAHSHKIGHPSRREELVSLVQTPTIYTVSFNTERIIKHSCILSISYSKLRPNQQLKSQCFKGYDYEQGNSRNQRNHPQ